jgi:hypothetical protein
MGFLIPIKPKKQKEGKDASHTVIVDVTLVLGPL